MPDWMKYNHVRRSVAATGMEVEARPGRACADCAHWRAWTPGDERCGVCVRWGGLATRDGWAGACGGFLEIAKGSKSTRGARAWLARDGMDDEWKPRLGDLTAKTQGGAGGVGGPPGAERGVAPGPAPHPPPPPPPGGDSPGTRGRDRGSRFCGDGERRGAVV